MGEEAMMGQSGVSGWEGGGRGQINAAVALCTLLCHFDKSHSQLTTPADSTLNPDWLEQLQVRRMLMDAVRTHTHTHKGKKKQTHKTVCRHLSN